MTEKQELNPPKARRYVVLEYDTRCVRCGWAFRSKASTRLSRSEEFTADCDRWSILTQKCGRSLLCLFPSCKAHSEPRDWRSCGTVL